MQKIFLIGLTSITMKNKHPMIMLIFILALSLVISIFLFILSMSYWMMLLIIMTFTGGLMVIFMYIVSLAPNEEETSSKSIPIILFITLFIMTHNFCNYTYLMTESYSTNYISMFTVSILIILMVHASSNLIINPFKGLKTSN